MVRVYDRPLLRSSARGDGAEGIAIYFSSFGNTHLVWGAPMANT